MGFGVDYASDQGDIGVAERWTTFANYDVRKGASVVAPASYLR